MSDCGEHTCKCAACQSGIHCGAHGKGCHDKCNGQVLPLKPKGRR